MQNGLILGFIMVCIPMLNAQSYPKLDKFEIGQKDGAVLLDWTMSSGSVCLGIKIERSEDTSSFTEIGNISGICGNLTKPMQYTFIDELAIKNKKLYYRLSFFGLGHSDIKSIVVIDVGKDDYEVFPNPVSSVSKLVFYNPRNEMHYIKIYDLNGKEMEVLETGDAFFEIDSEGFNSGYYFFVIFNSGYRNAISGRIEVKK
jgi:hypothetical protein